MTSCGNSARKRYCAPEASASCEGAPARSQSCNRYNGCTGARWTMTKQPNEQHASTSSDERRVIHAMSIDDAYHVERVLSRGAGGATELVTIDGSGPFVRKRMQAASARRTVWATLADCNCPHLPNVRATYEMPEEFVVVYDYFPGEPLGRYVAERGHLRPDEACHLAANVCEAAEALHRHGVVHRDIAPANIIVSSSGAHLIDFGISRMATTPEDDETPMGTWGYAAPEQYGFAATDARSDVYSIGKVLTFMLTGTQPDDKAFEELLASEALVPAWVKPIIERACAFEPSARFQSADDLAHALAGEREEGAAQPDTQTAEANSPIAGKAASEESIATHLAESFVSTSPNHPAGGTPHVSAPDRSPRPRKGKSRRGKTIAFAAIAMAVAVGAFVLGANAVNQIGRIAFHDNAAPESHIEQNQRDDATREPDRGIGQTTQDPATTAASGEANANANLSLPESSWQVTPNGYVEYAFALTSYETNRRVDFPEVNVTGRATDGSILFADTLTLNAIFPGQTAFWNSGAECSATPDSVEFEIADPLSYNILPTESSAPSFITTNVSARPRDTLGITVTGEVAWAEDSNVAALEEYMTDPHEIAVTVVFRDEAGKMLFADTGYFDMPAVGGSTPFDMVILNVPDYASFEAHARPW